MIVQVRSLLPEPFYFREAFNMKIPKKVKVGGITYKVKRVDLIHGGTTICGQCDCNRSAIELLNSSKKQQMEITFLHELLHTIFYHCDIEQDEHVVEALAQALYMIIKDNPGIFKD